MMYAMSQKWRNLHNLVPHFDFEVYLCAIRTQIYQTFNRLLTLYKVNRVMICSKSKVFVSCSKHPGWFWYLRILVFNSNFFYPVKSGLGLMVTTPRNVQSSSLIRRPALPLLHACNDVHNHATFTFTCKWLN